MSLKSFPDIGIFLVHDWIYSFRNKRSGTMSETSQIADDQLLDMKSVRVWIVCGFQCRNACFIRLWKFCTILVTLGIGELFEMKILTNKC